MLLIRAIFGSYSLGNQSPENGIKMLFGRNTITNCCECINQGLNAKEVLEGIDSRCCTLNLISQLLSPSNGVRIKERINLCPTYATDFCNQRLELACCEKLGIEATRVAPDLATLMQETHLKCNLFCDI